MSYNEREQSEKSLVYLDICSSYMRAVMDFKFGLGPYQVHISKGIDNFLEKNSNGMYKLPLTSKMGKEIYGIVLCTILPVSTTHV